MPSECRLSRGQPFSVRHSPSTAVYTLSLHDALPISARQRGRRTVEREIADPDVVEEGQALADLLEDPRSEEHTSELQSRVDLVCRLLLEKKKRADAQTARPRRADANLTLQRNERAAR